MNRRFLVISGLPGSGKSTLAARLAPALSLPVIDKDDILDRLFTSRGTGDDRWRRALSRESDAVLQAEAEASSGAILVSFWRLPGMSAESGTPVDWLRSLPGVIHVHCVCEVATATDRFVARPRHPGHLDRRRTHAEVFESLQQTAALGLLDIGSRIDVDTSGPVDVEALLVDVNRVLARA